MSYVEARAKPSPTSLLGAVGVNGGILLAIIMMPVAVDIVKNVPPPVAGSIPIDPPPPPPPPLEENKEAIKPTHRLYSPENHQ